jgi:hypothetical protein
VLISLCFHELSLTAFSYLFNSINLTKALVFVKAFWWWREAHGWMTARVFLFNPINLTKALVFVKAFWWWREAHGWMTARVCFSMTTILEADGLPSRPMVD